MMIHRTNHLSLPLLFFCLLLLNIGMVASVVAKQEQAEQGQQSQAPRNLMYGKVTEIIEASGYTYAEVDTGEKRVWAAGPVTPLKAGDMIAFSTAMPMENFHSKSMNRDFSILYFVNQFITDKDAPEISGAAGASPHGQGKPRSSVTPIEGIHKIEGGHTIAEVHARKEQLNVKTIRVRGQVTRFTAAVMNRNWLHIRDSSGPDDLTVTTADSAAIGDVVVIEGRLELDKDFGYGYLYPLIVQDAGITKE